MRRSLPRRPSGGTLGLRAGPGEPATPTDDASPPLQAPPRADHTNLPADEPVWAAARRGYVEDGLSCPVLAERHGLHVRTVQHHAANEDWPALRARHAAGGEVVRRVAARAQALDDPATGIVEALRAERLADLLVRPSGDALVREAARLAAEAAAARRPQETRLWLRAVREAERVAERIDRALADRDPLDAFRADYLHGLAEEIASAQQAREDEGAGEGAPLAPCHLDSAK